MARQEYDVIVIGSGFAGLSAAIEAGEAGARVLVLEKMKAPGGNSVISDGGVAVPGSALQAKQGLSDSPDQLYEDMLAAGLHLNYPELVRIVADGALDAWRWSRDHLGVRYLDRIDLFGGHSVARNHAAEDITGASIIKPMLQKIRELDIALEKGVCLHEFILEDGKVVGVQADRNYSHKGDTAPAVQAIRCERGVVLASGGYGADVAFRGRQDPRLGPKIDTTNKPFATAEAMKAAMRIGAAAVQLSHIQLGPWASPEEKGFGAGPLFADYIGFIHGMIVDPFEGRRFVDERSDRKTLSDALLEVGSPCLNICDHRAVRDSGLDIGRALKKKVVRTYLSLQALADACGIPDANLRESVAEFESLAGRKDKPRIRENPLYCMKIWPKVHYTMGGLQIDTGARVIDLDGRPIPGLYAAGEVTGGIHGASRLGSCAITDCLVFGRIAGREAARWDRS